MTTQESVADRYRRLGAVLTSRVEAVPIGNWDNPSPCEGWTARDVLGHIIDSEAQLVTQVGLEIPEGPAVEADPAAAWSHTRDRMQAILDDPKKTNLEYDGFFGRTNLSTTVGSFFCFDLVVHGWDIARATVTDEMIPTEDLRMVGAFANQMGDNIRMEGVCGPAVEVPTDADEQTRVLATLGRTA